VCDVERKTDVRVEVHAPGLHGQRLRKRSDGFANRPFDNVGHPVRPRRAAHRWLSPAQFVDLTLTSGRRTTTATRADARARRPESDCNGLTRVGSRQRQQLDQVAIIDLRGPDPGAFQTSTDLRHARAAAPELRDRCQSGALARQASIAGGRDFADDAVVGRRQWVARVTPIAAKCRWPRRSGGQAGDSRRPLYRTGSARHPLGGCDETVAAYGTPRFAAVSEDRRRVEMQLKPLVRGDYSVTFTDPSGLP